MIEALGLFFGGDEFAAMSLAKFEAGYDFELTLAGWRCALTAVWVGQVFDAVHAWCLPSPYLTVLAILRQMIRRAAKFLQISC
jgi:hypothetical protein